MNVPNQLTPTITRVSDIVPKERLTPFPKGLYHEVLKDTLYLFIPIAASVVLSLVAGVILFATVWLATLAFGFGFIGIALLLMVHDTYTRELHQVELNTQDHQRVTTAILQIINHIEVNNFQVNRGGVVNTGLMQQVNSESVQVDTTSENARYQLALKIAEIGIEAWSRNRGMRPRPKPISAEAITELLKGSDSKTGREKWTAAMTMLEDAQVYFKPLSPSQWKPLVADIRQAKELLDRQMVGEGMFLSRHNNTETWLK